MTAPAPGSQITWDWIVLEREGLRGGWIFAHHVAAELCGGHCGKVGGTGVVFAAADDGHAAQLALNECQNFVVCLLEWMYLCGSSRAWAGSSYRPCPRSLSWKCSPS